VFRRLDTQSDLTDTEDSRKGKSAIRVWTVFFYREAKRRRAEGIIDLYATTIRPSTFSLAIESFLVLGEAKKLDLTSPMVTICPTCCNNQ
jgi:hypothetical protein